MMPLCHCKTQPAHDILVRIALSNNAVSGEPVQMRKPAKAIAARIRKGCR